MMRLPIATACILVATAAACYPTFAPPVRMGLTGTPGTVETGQVLLGVDAPGGGMPAGAEAYVVMQLTDWVGVETGVGWFTQTSVMGFVGVRLNLLDEPVGAVRFAIDTSIGGGAGVGGSLCGNDYEADSDSCPGRYEWDGLHWYDRAAGGGYLGLGFGMHADLFSIYLRARWDLTAATAIPVTNWFLLAVGVQFEIHRVFAIYGGSGIFLYAIEANHLLWVLWEVGLTVRFDAFDKPIAAAGS